MGNTALFSQMQAASTLIKRDVVFAVSDSWHFCACESNALVMRIVATAYGVCCCCFQFVMCLGHDSFQAMSMCASVIYSHYQLKYLCGAVCLTCAPGQLLWVTSAACHLTTCRRLSTSHKVDRQTIANSWKSAPSVAIMGGMQNWFRQLQSWLNSSIAYMVHQCLCILLTVEYLAATATLYVSVLVHANGL